MKLTAAPANGVPVELIAEPPRQTGSPTLSPVKRGELIVARDFCQVASPSGGEVSTVTVGVHIDTVKVVLLVPSPGFARMVIRQSRRLVQGEGCLRRDRLSIVVSALIGFRDPVVLSSKENEADNSAGYGGTVLVLALQRSTALRFRPVRRSVRYLRF